ncbi:hypothetical protein M9Y10_020624 [Tritrichomonas musculus]|uniref:Uncharacterized protein n=1 Tax=Tritrichomonas musculus TaxID=1915356 RepID=A0ABR2HE46_9EUKA
MPISGLRDDVIQLFEKLKNEKNRSQFMKYLMIDLYNDDEQHGDNECAYHKDNYNKRGKNYLFSVFTCSNNVETLGTCHFNCTEMNAS